MLRLSGVEESRSLDCDAAPAEVGNAPGCSCQCLEAAARQATLHGTAAARAKRLCGPNALSIL